MRYIANKEIAAILFEMSALYEMEGVEFKPRAYERAALGVLSLPRPLGELYQETGSEALTTIPGVGKTIAGHLQEILQTGHFRDHEKLKKKTPVKIGELLAVEGVGPRTVKTLWEKLKIRDLKDLEKAARRGLIRHLPGFGERSEQKILKGIEFVKQAGGRQLLGLILPQAVELETALRRFPEVKKAVAAGSIRRRQETIGDIDLLVISQNPEKTMQQFVALPSIAHVFGQGSTKTNVRLKSGIDVDVRVIPVESFGAALNYFTGSKEHNVALRELALKKGWKLNEYGLFSAKGGRRLAGRTEEELYEKLGLIYIEPELRENKGEIEAALRQAQGKLAGLPKLIGYQDLRGDLQVHTNWTDGRSSLWEMAQAGEAAGLEYLAITDHTKKLAMTGGLDEARILRQGKEIDKINVRLQTAGSTLRLLKGVEVNILKDGTLDLADEALAQLEMVGAAVHSHFDLPREVQTKRLIKAMENPNVDIIFHPSGRLINRRKAIELDWDEIIKVAKETGTVLEIDAFPDRLDLDEEQVRRCVEAGVKMVISSDAHSPEHLRYLEFGIAQARRGWAEKKDIINTLSFPELLRRLKGHP